MPVNHSTHTKNLNEEANVDLDVPLMVQLFACEYMWRERLSTYKPDQIDKEPGLSYHDRPVTIVSPDDV